MCQDQPFKALGDDGFEYNWVVVLVSNNGQVFGTGMMVAGFRQDGIVDCDREKGLKNFGEDLWELCCIGPEHLPRNTVE